MKTESTRDKPKSLKTLVAEEGLATPNAYAPENEGVFQRFSSARTITLILRHPAERSTSIDRPAGWSAPNHIRWVDRNHFTIEREVAVLPSEEPGNQNLKQSLINIF